MIEWIFHLQGFPNAQIQLQKDPIELNENTGALQEEISTLFFLAKF